MDSQRGNLFLSFFGFSIEDSCFYVKFSCSVEWICLHLSDLIYWWGHWRWNCHWRWKCDRYLHYCFFWACETCNRKHKMATFSHCCFPILSFCVGGICWFFVKRLQKSWCQVWLDIPMKPFVTYFAEVMVSLMMTQIKH